MRRERIILGLALLGMLLAGYAIPLHYADSGHAICNISANFNCDKVNKSPWSELFGIPVSILGLLANLGLFFLVLKRRTIAKALDFSKKDMWQYIGVYVAIMLAFQIYLTYVEVAYIHAYCLVCLTNQVLLLLLAYLTFAVWKKA